MIVWRQPKAWPGALLCFRPTDGKLGTFFLCSDHFVYKWLWGSITVSSTSTWLSFYQMSTGQVDIQSSRLLFLNGLIYSNPRTNVRIHPQPHEVCFLIERVLCPLTKKLRTDKLSQNQICLYQFYRRWSKWQKNKMTRCWWPGDIQRKCLRGGCDATF